MARVKRDEVHIDDNFGLQPSVSLLLIDHLRSDLSSHANCFIVFCLFVKLHKSLKFMTITIEAEFLLELQPLPNVSDHCLNSSVFVSTRTCLHFFYILCTALCVSCVIRIPN